MSSLGYCVRFIRKDGAVPDTENYYYWNQADAAEHLQMFSDMDDADLKEMYSLIQMLVIDGQMFDGVVGNKVLKWYYNR